MAPHQVQQAEGAIFDLQSEGNTVKLYNEDGDAAGNSQAPSFGFGFDGDAERFNPLKLVDGEWVDGASQVVIDQGTAEDQGWAIGDRIRAAAEGPAQEFTITGIARLGDVESLGGATLALFDLATAQQLLNKEGQLDTIFVASDEGVTPEELTANIEPVLPASAQVRTGAQQASADSSGISEGVDFIRYFLLAFGLIALFVGAFVIVNSLSITIAQRTRELATLRTLGASRRQVREAGPSGKATSVCCTIRSRPLGWKRTRANSQPGRFGSGGSGMYWRRSPVRGSIRSTKVFARPSASQSSMEQ